jgi:hypothetical protein
MPASDRTARRLRDRGQAALSSAKTGKKVVHNLLENLNCDFASFQPGWSDRVGGTVAHTGTDCYPRSLLFTAGREDRFPPRAADLRAVTKVAFGANLAVKCPYRE